MKDLIAYAGCFVFGFAACFFVAGESYHKARKQSYQAGIEEGVKDTLNLWDEAIVLAKLKPAFRTPEQNFVYYSCLARAKSDTQKQACGYWEKGK